jgi:hypothetical protein
VIAQSETKPDLTQFWRIVLFKYINGYSGRNITTIGRRRTCLVVSLAPRSAGWRDRMALFPTQGLNGSFHPYCYTQALLLCVRNTIFSLELLPRVLGNSEFPSRVTIKKMPFHVILPMEFFTENASKGNVCAWLSGAG